MCQLSKTQRRFAVGAFLIAAGPVALGSVAHAGALVSVRISSPSVSAGGAVTVTGTNYSPQAFGPDVPAPFVPNGPTGSSPVEVRLDQRNGRVIGTASTGTTRRFSTQVTIPSDVAAGVHTLIVMQYYPDGVLVSGGPGRVSFTVTAAGGSRTAAEGTVAPAAAPSNDPAAAAPAAAPAPSAPVAAIQTSAARDAGTTAAAPAVAVPTAGAPSESEGTVPSGAAPSAALAFGAPDAASPPAPASTAVSSLVPASSESRNVLPGLTLGVGLALVLLSLGALVKSGRNMLDRGFTPLVG